MSYAIATVVLGTYYTEDAYEVIEEEYTAVSDRCLHCEEPEASHRPEPSASNGEHAFERIEVDEVDDILDREPWVGLYSSGGCRIAYVGEVLCEFDETENQLWSALIGEVEDAAHGKHTEARRKYESIPLAARLVLPRFGIHVIWSSS